MEGGVQEEVKMNYLLSLLSIEEVACAREMLGLKFFQSDSNLLNPPTTIKNPRHLGEYLMISRLRRIDY